MASSEVSLDGKGVNRIKIENAEGNNVSQGNNPIFNLETLMRLVTKENIHQYIDLGRRVGKEKI
ncbi:hypothetical protein [Tatumella ptyseos]|uniref:hypothetical protein n=1 Tax=Tatumella ptyseos TaxID=82987 RepID=UPI0026F374A0|nr:hypothetical protein [Tatumella ptyseos]WKX27199.1 hypothetical protein QJR74_03375 [Tatumella ptyseos]